MAALVPIVCSVTVKAEISKQLQTLPFQILKISGFNFLLHLVIVPFINSANFQIFSINSESMYHQRLKPGANSQKLPSLQNEGFDRKVRPPSAIENHLLQKIMTLKL